MRKFLLLLGLQLGLTVNVGAFEGEQLLEVSNFSGGLNSADSSLLIDNTEVRDALNVDFNADGSVSKRTGFTLYASSSGVKYLNSWAFVDSSNTSWIITLSTDCIRASDGDGVIDIIIATVPTPSISRVSAVAALGNIYFVDNVQGLYLWNGTSTTYISGSPLGSLIAEYKGRIWVAGFAAPSQNRLQSSAYLEATNWTTSFLDTSPVDYIIGLNDRSDGITGLFSGSNDALYVTKNRSIGAVLGFDQLDFEYRVLNTEAGCIDQGSIRSYANGLICSSERGFDYFDGANWTLVSDPIDDKLSRVKVGTYNQQSWVQDTSLEFAAGTLTNLTTSYIDGKLYLTSSTGSNFTDTTSDDFGYGTWSGDVLFINTSDFTPPNSLQLKRLGGSVTVALNTGTVSAPYTGQRIYDGSFDYGPTFIATGPYTITGGKFYMGGVPVSAGCGSLPVTYPLYFQAALLKNGVILSTTPSVTITGIGAYTVTLNTPVYLETGASYSWRLAGISGGDSCFDPFAFRIYGNYWYETYAQRTLTDGGSFTSRTFDIGYATSSQVWSWGTFSTTQSPVHSSYNLSFLLGVSSDSTNWTDYAVSTGTIPSIPFNRYVRYTAQMSSTDEGLTPYLYDVTIGSVSFRSTSGNFRSAIKRIGAINSWSLFTVSEDETTGGSIVYSICTSSSSNMIPSACASGLENSAIFTATNTYVQVFSTFTITVATQNPSLDLFALRWNAGEPKPNIASVVYKDRYYIAVSTSGNSENNDCIFILDRKRGGGFFWTVYDIDAGAFVISRGSLYHADANATGNIYLDDQGYHDNNSAIDSYFITKDYAPGGIITEKIYDKFWVVIETLGNYNFNSSYYLDKHSRSFDFDDIDQNETEGVVVGRLPFKLAADKQVFGRTIGFRFGNNEINAPFTSYGGVLSYKVRKP